MYLSGAVEECLPDTSSSKDTREVTTSDGFLNPTCGQVSLLVPNSP